MKKTLLYLILFFITINLFSQPWKGNNQFLYDFIKDYPLSENEIYYRIPLTFWLYKSNDGVCGASRLEVKKEIEQLNYYFTTNNTGIIFYLNEIIIISNSQRQKLGYYIEAPIVTTLNHESGSINIHLVDTLEKKVIKTEKRNYKAKRITGTHNNVNHSIIITRHNSVTGLSHEIGHYFGLEHPHRNWNKGKLRQESVNRERKKGLLKIKYNCEKTGDYLSDTPAEPALIYDFDENCKYVGERVDNWGDKYRPATNNIMSYQRDKTCRTIFTTQQKAVMLYTISKNRHHLAWRSENLQNTFDIYEPDNSRTNVNPIYLNTPQYHTFHKKYKGKHKSDNENDIDWLKFYPKTDSLKQIKICFTKGKYNFPQMQISITNQLNKKIHKQIIYKPCNIAINNILNRNYYIKIELLQSADKEHFTDYNIEIKEKIEN